jgi:hypothetical protein
MTKNETALDLFSIQWKYSTRSYILVFYQCTSLNESQMAPFLLTVYVYEMIIYAHYYMQTDFCHLWIYYLWICTSLIYVIIYYIIFQDGGRSDDAHASVPWTRTQAGTVATEQVQRFNNRYIIHMYNDILSKTSNFLPKEISHYF